MCLYISGLVYLVPLFVIYEKLLLTGSYPSLVLYDLTFELPFVVFMLRSYFSDISWELDDDAWVDGCSRWLAFRKIMSPLIVPGLSTVTILIAIRTWGEYFGALISVTFRPKRRRWHWRTISGLIRRTGCSGGRCTVTYRARVRPGHLCTARLYAAGPVGVDGIEQRSGGITESTSRCLRMLGTTVCWSLSSSVMPWCDRSTAGCR